MNPLHLMNRLALAWVALSCAAASGEEQKAAPPNGSSEMELRRLEKTWNDAHLEGNEAPLDVLWADELTVTVPKMPVFNKSQSLAIWRTGRMKFTRYETSDLVFRVFDDSAVVTGSVIRERRFMEKEAHDDWRFTKVYVRRNGKWRVVAWHASEAAQKQAEVR